METDGVENRDRRANRFVRQLKKFIDGLGKHPRALNGIYERPSVTTIKSKARMLDRLEEKREKALQTISEINLAEAALIQEYTPIMNRLRSAIKGKNYGKPQVYKDFFEG